MLWCEQFTGVGDEIETEPVRDSAVSANGSRRWQHSERFHPLFAGRGGGTSVQKFKVWSLPPVSIHDRMCHPLHVVSRLAVDELFRQVTCSRRWVSESGARYSPWPHPWQAPASCLLLETTLNRSVTSTCKQVAERFREVLLSTASCNEDCKRFWERGLFPNLYRIRNYDFL